MGLFSRQRREDSAGEEAEVSQRSRFNRRTVVAAGLAGVAIILTLGGWLAFNAQAAKANLEAARASAQQAKEALLAGNTADASRFSTEAQERAQAARDATHSVPWSIASTIPVVGSPFETGRQISDVVLGLAKDVLRPTAEAGTAVAPSQLFANGQLDVAALRREEPALSKVNADAARLNAEAQSIPNPAFISRLGEARSQLQAQTADIAELMSNTALAAKLVPSMMGADGPRTYFMGFQTNAEARGTGGLLGGFGILRFDNGKPTVDALGPNTTLDGPFTPFSLDSDFDRLYGFTNPTTDVRNSNQSSHFPYAARIWKAMWEQTTGRSVDGVIAIDPFALSYILGATGPVVMPDGETVRDDNVVELTESTIYERFPADQTARKQYLQAIAGEVVKKITKPIESPRALLNALGRAINERRISVWSASVAEQRLLEQTPLAHAVPEDSAPYAEVVINNLGGNKVDYYLTRQIEYSADGCDGTTRASTVTVRLTNGISDAEALPDYVAARLGFFPDIRAEIPKGTMISSVRLLATKDAKLASVFSGDKRIQVFEATERGHPSFEAQLAIPPGKPAELTFRLSEPVSAGEARVPVQPLVDKTLPNVSVPTCSR